MPLTKESVLIGTVVKETIGVPTVENGAMDFTIVENENKTKEEGLGMMTDTTTEVIIKVKQRQNMVTVTMTMEDPTTQNNCKNFNFVQKPMWFENYDLENIVTPVKYNILEEFLRNSNYNPEKTEFLVNGFRNGFSIRYDGPKQIRKFAHNLRLRVSSKVELWNKVMKEVSLHRYVGPFKTPPFINFIQSPIGLVDKDHGKNTRLIFHLSYPKGGNSSVNSNTDQEYCHVKYVDFDHAISLCLHELQQDANNQMVYIGKSDYKSDFRNVGLDKNSWQWLILKQKIQWTVEYISLSINACHSDIPSVVPYFKTFQLQWHIWFK